MHHPQILVYEGDNRLAAMLKPLADERRWSLREPRQLESCLRLFRRGGPGVLVIEIGRDLERELALLERVGWLLPDVRIVVVGENSHAGLASLAWDLGASYVLFPPLAREWFVDIVAALAAPAERTTERAR